MGFACAQPILRQRNLNGVSPGCPSGRRIERSEVVGWVEHSETHQAAARQMMGFASFNPSYGVVLPERRTGLSGVVGWVEHSETYQAAASQMMGFASFNPSYGVVPPERRPD